VTLTGTPPGHVMASALPATANSNSNTRRVMVARHPAGFQERGES
jgi:hypothetical protein